MKKKYSLIKEGHLYRIKALRSFGDISAGDIGGLIESERNLSHTDTAWVYNNAKVTRNARVYDDTRISDTAGISGNARVYNGAMISGNVRVYNDAWIFCDDWISGNVMINGAARINKALITANRSDGYIFLICRDKDKELRISAGCRYFTIPEAIKHWKTTRKGTQLGRESLQLVSHLKKMAEITDL